MSAPTPEPTVSDVGWQGYLVGFVFAVLVLGGVAIATAMSYDNDPGADDHGAETSDTHAEDGDDGHGDEGDESHGEEPADAEHDG